MKKVFFATLAIAILSMFLPFSAQAAGADQDPVVGSWYISFYDPAVAVDEAYQLSVFIMNNDYSISSAVIDIKKDGTVGGKYYGTIGLWTKSDGKYLYTVPGSNSIEIKYENDTLLFPVNGAYYRLRRLETANYTTDYMPIE